MSACSSSTLAIGLPPPRFRSLTYRLLPTSAPSSERNAVVSSSLMETPFRARGRPPASGRGRAPLCRCIRQWSGLFWSAASAARRKPMLKGTLQQYKIISYCKYNELYSKTPPHAHPRFQVTSRHTVRSRLSASKPPGHAVRFRLSATAVPPVPLPNPCALPPLPVPPPDPCLLPNSATAALPPFRPIPAYRPVVPHHSAARFRHIATAFSRIHKTAGFLARLCSFRARRGEFSGVRARFSCFRARRGSFSDFWAQFCGFRSRRSEIWGPQGGLRPQGPNVPIGGGRRGESCGI